MMRTYRLILLVVLIVAISPAAIAQHDELFTEADAAAARVFLRANFVRGDSGMVIGLLDRNGSRVFSAGKLGDGSDREVDGDTVFELGSVTKVFTALLALEAASRGEVKLDEPVSQYLPRSVKLPAYDGKEITMRHLAAQDSGLPFHHGKFNDWQSKGLTLKELKKASEELRAEDLHAFLSSCTLPTAPGTQYGYSNPGMALLAHAIELTTGQSYESLVVDRICARLGMESTRITLTPEMQARLARGHYLDGEPAENIRLKIMAGAGAFLSTTNDMLKFVAANLGFTQKTELSPLLAEMQVVRHTGVPEFGNTAMPWMDQGVYQPPGSRFYGHAGGGFGYLAFIGFDKGKSRGVVVLSNQMVFSSHGVGWTLLQGMPLTRENIAMLVREFVGLGLAFEADAQSDLPRITKVYPDSPAGDAGLVPGMRIQAIGGMQVAKKTVQECLALMKGAEGDLVRIEVNTAPDREEPRVVELRRRKFVTTSERIK